MKKAYFRAFHLRPKVGAFKRISRKFILQGLFASAELTKMD